MHTNFEFTITEELIDYCRDDLDYSVLDPDLNCKLMIKKMLEDNGCVFEQAWPIGTLVPSGEARQAFIASKGIILVSNESETDLEQLKTGGVLITQSGLVLMKINATECVRVHPTFGIFGLEYVYNFERVSPTVGTRCVYIDYDLVKAP